MQAHLRRTVPAMHLVMRQLEQGYILQLYMDLSQSAAALGCSEERAGGRPIEWCGGAGGQLRRTLSETQSIDWETSSKAQLCFAENAGA